MATRYFISYASANDDVSFYVDYLHFRNRSRFRSGVPKTELFVAISEVIPFTPLQHDIWAAFYRRFSVTEIELSSVSFKSNIGRDFSSHALNLRLISKQASSGDYVLFLNRSAYGPLCDDWYGAYVKQFERYEGTALCSSTINLAGHPSLEADGGNTAHVQTYSFLGQFPFLNKFLESFPGEHEDTRLGVIEHGEIGLSQWVTRKGNHITCLAWPNHVLWEGHPADKKLPMRDIKNELSYVKNLPFRYKFSKYGNISAKLCRWRDFPSLGIRVGVRRLVELITGGKRL